VIPDEKKTIASAGIKPFYQLQLFIF